MSKVSYGLIVTLVILTLASVTAAQHPGDPGTFDDPIMAIAAEHHLIDGFGTGPQVATISPLGLVPDEPETTLTYRTGGYRYVVNDAGGLIKVGFNAGTDLPVGAVLAVACLQVRDTLSTGEIELAMWAFEQPTNPGTVPYVDLVSDWETSGWSWNSGYTSVCILPVVTLRTFGDLDSDGTSGRISYAFGVDFTGPVGPDLAVGSISILWGRQISPAPATATFSDVPVGAFGFQHIEALVASGITAGCGSGNYCPDAPLTRAQMAVFLAKGLGLHFPQ